ncbi:MAG: pirin family protein [Rhodospirillales bacterium]|nr:pirin family protein [Rhodospirillales bacterium]
MTLRTVTLVQQSQLTSDGAGVTLRRSIGTQMLSELDPFLLLDNFGTDNPDDYIAGFPDHPHRGFETVTYMIKGLMRHRDNTGAEGLLKPGGVQWMTAGRGIIHSEMPEQSEGEMSGFQLWVNLPSIRKMCEPRYQDIDPEDVPTVSRDDGTVIKVIAGSVDGVDGPVDGIDIEPLYLDISLPAQGSFQQTVPAGHTVFIYVFEGSVEVDGSHVDVDSLAVLGNGDEVAIESAAGGRFILLAGKPFGEPIARYGPFVMNTKDEIRQAIEDYNSGKF